MHRASADSALKSVDSALKSLQNWHTPLSEKPNVFLIDKHHVSEI